MSEEAAAVVRLVGAVRQQGSLSHVVDVLRGAQTKLVRDKGHDQLPDHGAGKSLRYAASCS